MEKVLFKVKKNGKGLGIRNSLQKVFESLGFTIRDRDFEGKKKGSDFFIELDGCIQSVAAKTKMGKFSQLLQPQIDRLI